MFGIGETELVIIVVFAFLLFGPDKLPGMGRTLGRVLRQFREASNDLTEVVQTNIMDPAADELQKSPKQRRREEAAEADADADREGAAEEVAPRRETFAERKARLAAERAAAERREFADEDESAPGADSDEDLQEVPARRSAADLYALTATSPKRAEAAEATTLSGEEGEDA